MQLILGTFFSVEQNWHEFQFSVTRVNNLSVSETSLHTLFGNQISTRIVAHGDMRFTPKQLKENLSN